MNGNINLNEFLNELVSVIKKKFDAYDMAIKGMKTEIDKLKTVPQPVSNPGSNPNLNQVAVRNLETKLKSLEFSLNSLKNSLGNKVDKAILKPLESEKK